jgi:TolA-binding protein
MRHWLCVTALLCVVSVPGAAQEIAPGTPPAVYRAIERARLLDSRGDHARARQALDSLVAQLPSGTDAMVEALFWRATYAADGVDAERDYRRLLVEQPRHRRREESLARLAEYEIVRGRLPEGRALLQQLFQEYPEPQSQGRMAYWLARSWFDEGETERGCSALRVATARATDGDSALRSLVTRAARRCPQTKAP